jgi:hypothetical protein
LTVHKILYGPRILVLLLFVWYNGVSSLLAQGQDLVLTDSVKEIVKVDSARIVAVSDSILTASIEASLRRERFVPDPIRAMWLGLVFPGGGQIYNHKYWKLPIIYGGFLGCVYALTWNTQMLHDYSQAYLDIMDSDPNTKSYEKMLPIGYDITGREERFKNIFKNKKNFFRRNRDLSLFAFAGVYLLAVIDAYVDAELSTFDISEDLSLHIEPTFIQTLPPRTSGRETIPGVKFVLSY